VQSHVNFISWAPRQILEVLAAGTVKASITASVAKVFDQYLNFVALEPDLFSLCLQESYVHLNDNTASEAEVNAAVTSVVEGLFSVCVTLSIVPVIRCAAGGLAEAVGRALSQKIVGHLKGRGASLLSDPSAFLGSTARPLLCLFDRNFDLTAMVEQPFTYKALVHDCQGLHLNKVQISQASVAEGTVGKKLTIEISDDDVFWQQNGHQEFGVVAASIDEQVWSDSSTALFQCVHLNGCCRKKHKA
jgi:sec1 family domain-containing protein 1